MSEQAPQPQDILAEAQSYDSFNSWLSQIPDERLQHFVNVISKGDSNEASDQEAMDRLIGVAMHFRGDVPMTELEVTKAWLALVAQVGAEVYVRNGILTKQGEYSMSPEGQTAIFTPTDKGKEMFGHGGDV